MLKMLFILIFINNTVIAQSKEEFFKKISKDWIADSNANNNFRINTFKKILKYKNTNFTKKFVLKYLGIPSKVNIEDYGSKHYALQYYTYDGRKTSPQMYACYYISFIFDKKNDNFIMLGSSSYDL